MNNQLLIEAVEIAVDNWDYDGEEYKAEIGRLFLKSLLEGDTNV